MLFIFFYYLLSYLIDPTFANSKIMVGKPGFCYINFENDKITSSFVCSETKKILDTFEIVKK